MLSRFYYLVIASRAKQSIFFLDCFGLRPRNDDTTNLS